MSSVFVLLIGGFMAFLDTSIVNVAIPSIMNVFGAVDDLFIITSVLTLVGLVPAFFLKKSSTDKRTAAMDA